MTTLLHTSSYNTDYGLSPKLLNHQFLTTMARSF